MYVVKSQVLCPACNVHVSDTFICCIVAVCSCLCSIQSTLIFVFSLAAQTRSVCCLTIDSAAFLSTSDSLKTLKHHA